MYSFSAGRLRDARTAAGLTPEHVAIACDRSSFTVREWERGRVTPPTDVVCLLAEVLAIPITGLFEGGGDAHAA